MKRKFILTLATILVAIGSPQAQKKENGFYLDTHIAFNSIGSGFDGESILVAADDVFAVPEFDSGIGFGLAVGFRFEELYTEFSFQRTTHNFMFTGIDGDAVQSIWSLNFRRLFLKNSKLQPFLQIGWMPIMPLRVKEGALLISQDINSDAIFLGGIGNFNAGGGVEFIVGSKLSTRFSILYKRARYVSVESSEENVAIKLEDDINANDINMTLGIIFVF